MRLLVLLLFAAGVANSQPKVSIIPVVPGWKHITRVSGMIFSGCVMQVDRATNPAGTTQITFRVENAIRGVQKGQIIRIREWAGLWDIGERYRKGEHVLLFLYPKSKLRLTSPVGGSAGKFAVDSAGRVLIATPQLGRPRPIPVKSVKAQITRSLQE